MSTTVILFERSIKFNNISTYSFKNLIRFLDIFSLTILSYVTTEMILRFYENPTAYENSKCPLYRNKTVSTNKDKCIIE